MKFQRFSFDGYFNIAAFEVSKENLARNIGNPLTQIGRTNLVFELEAVANVEELTLIGNVSFIDSEITEDENGSHAGKPPASQIAPNQLASAWANYRFGGP